MSYGHRGGRAMLAAHLSQKFPTACGGLAHLGIISFSVILGLDIVHKYVENMLLPI